MNRRHFLGLVPAVALTGGLAHAAKPSGLVYVVTFRWDDARHWHSESPYANVNHMTEEGVYYYKYPSEDEILETNKFMKQWYDTARGIGRGGMADLPDGIDRFVCTFEAPHG